jgi:hypothetical protein
MRSTSHMAQRRAVVAARSRSRLRRDFDGMTFGDFKAVLEDQGLAGARARRYSTFNIVPIVRDMVKNYVPSVEGFAKHVSNLMPPSGSWADLGGAIGRAAAMAQSALNSRAAARQARRDLLATVRAIGDALRAVFTPGPGERLLRHQLDTALRALWMLLASPRATRGPTRSVQIVATLAAAPHGPTVALAAAA